MTCQDIEELTGAYVLDALSEEERGVVEKHLAQCSSCIEITQELQQVVQMLPLIVPSIAPSPFLKQSLLIKIQATPIKREEHADSSTSKQKQRWNWKIALLAVAAVLLLTFSGIITAWNLSLQQQLVQSSSISTTIQGTAQDKEAYGQFTYLPQQHSTILVVQGLPELKGTQIYQSWGIQNKRTSSIGILNQQGKTATLDIQGDVRNYEAVAISLEPGPQASVGKPRGPIVAQSSKQIGKGVSGRR